MYSGIASGWILGVFWVDSGGGFCGGFWVDSVVDSVMDSGWIVRVESGVESG